MAGNMGNLDGKVKVGCGQETIDYQPSVPSSDNASAIFQQGKARQRVQLKLFVNESTWIERLRFIFVKDQRSSLRIRLFNFVLKLITVGLYLFRAIYDDPRNTTCCGHCARNWTIGESNPTWKDQYSFSWEAIVWVHRPFVVWIIQVVLALICFIHAILSIVVNYKGNLTQNVFTLNNLLEFICTAPFIASLTWWPLRCIFAPVFLNIWLANSGLNNMMNDLQRATQRQKSAMFNQMCLLLSTILALLITCICSVEHFERAGKFRMDVFDATWFVIVTFSTVGYGDITPTIWPSRVAIMVIIVVALSVLPSKIEDLAHLWSQRQKQGGVYSRQRATTEKHVIVCATELRLDVIMQFLNEFYAHPVFQKHYVVLLSPTELDGALKLLLQIPIWTERVIYIQGSALRESDLLRAKLDAAEACFILTSRQEADRDAADQKTILRAMACKEHAPHCPLYVQILKPDSKFHVQFADQVICDEEFKYALLAMNCYIPGLSTMVTMLAHTSKGREGHSLKAEWKRMVGRSAGNEIYHVVAENSKFFGEYIGYRFSQAAQLAHAKCGATLFGMKREGEIFINPGFSRVIQNEDVLFYICLTSEEDATIVSKNEDIADIARTLFPSSAAAEKELFEKQAARRCSVDGRARGLSSHPSEESIQGNQCNDPQFDNAEKMLLKSDITDPSKTTIGFPPIFPYIGHVTPTLCHILRERKMYCCLRHDRKCNHERFDEFENDPIIVCAEFATQSLINVMIPLRAHYRSTESLNPLILVLEHSPENGFLEAMSCFPMVYYMLGNMGSLDALLVAGIIRAHTVIIIDRVTSVYAEEEYMADSRQLVAAQSIFKLFPSARTCLELTHASNIRFNRFVSPNERLSTEEIQEKRQSEKAASLPYLFCESFVAGEVFSSSMLDTLLYQSMVKNYLMTLLRLLLGLQYGPGSGHLTTYEVSKFDENKKYSAIFKEISYRTGGIILGIFREAKLYKPYVLPKMAEEKIDLVNEISELPSESRKVHKNSVSGFNMKRSLKSKLQMKSNRKASSNVSVRRLQMLHHSMTEREKLDRTIQDRMASLGIPVDQNPPRFRHFSFEKTKQSFGYVILNPQPDILLTRGDILYVIEPEYKNKPPYDSGADAVGMKSIEELNESASITLESDTASTPPVASTMNRRSTLTNEKTSAVDKHLTSNGISTQAKVTITVQSDVSEAANNDPSGWA